MEAIKDKLKALKLSNRAKFENRILMASCFMRAEKIAKKLYMYLKLKADKELCDKLIWKLQDCWHSHAAKEQGDLTQWEIFWDWSSYVHMAPN